MKSLTLASLTLFAALPALAAPSLSSSDPTCNVQDTTAQRVVEFPGSPSWFAKANMDVARNKVYFLHNGDPSGNTSLDLETGQMRPMPGSVDPVPTPDGLFITNPGVSYFDADDAERNGTRARNIFNTQQSAPYQSVGRLPGGSDDVRTYRSISDQQAQNLGVSFADTEISGRGSSASGRKIKEGRMCTTVDGAPGPVLRLPIISKDGQKLSVYDATTGTSKVLKADPNDPSQCTTELDLGLPTGKAEFNAQNNQLVFHVDTGLASVGEWFSSAGAGRNLNVFTLDLNTKRMTRVTNNMGGNSYYPSFRNDGSVVYLQQSANGKYSAVIADPTQGQSIQLSQCSPGDPNYQKTLALGKLWSTLCHQLNDNAELGATALFGLSLNPDQCRQMVNQYWNQNRTRVANDLAARDGTHNRVQQGTISGLSVDDLLSVCPTTNRAASAPSRISAGGGGGTPDPVVPPPANQVSLTGMIGQCRQCHSSPMQTSSGNQLAAFPSDQDLNARGRRNLFGGGGRANIWMDKDSGNGQKWKERIRNVLTSPNPPAAMVGQFDRIVPDSANRDTILQTFN